MAGVSADPKPCPCLFSNPAAIEAQNSLRKRAVMDEYTRFCNQYRLLPQSVSEAQSMHSFWAAGNRLQTTLAEPGFKRRNIPTWFIAKDKSRHLIHTDMYEGLGLAEITMPWPYTPVCTGLHFPSLLDPQVLRSLKAAGVDVIVILVPGIIDVANVWAREQLAQAKLEHLMPQEIPADDLDFRLTPNPDLPLILVQADPGLEYINERGLVREIPGLGLAAERAYSFYDPNGVLTALVKAEDPSAQHCGAVLGSAMLDKAQELQLQTRFALRN